MPWCAGGQQCHGGAEPEWGTAGSAETLHLSWGNVSQSWTALRKLLVGAGRMWPFRSPYCWGQWQAGWGLPAPAQGSCGQGSNPEHPTQTFLASLDKIN